MNSDLEKRVPREILTELIEEGTEAFRGIRFWRSPLFNVAMQLESSEFLGAEAYERTASRRGYRNGFKGKQIQDSSRSPRAALGKIPQVRGLRFYPKSDLERAVSAVRRRPSKLAIAEMYVMGVSTRKVDRASRTLAAVWAWRSRPPRSREWPGMLDEELCEELSKPGAGRVSDRVTLDAHYDKVRLGGGRSLAGRGHP